MSSVWARPLLLRAKLQLTRLLLQPFQQGACTAGCMLVQQKTQHAARRWRYC